MSEALVNAPYTARVTVYQGSVATDPSPDSATVTVTRADGTVVESPGSAASADGVGGFSHTFTSAALPRPDVYRIDWAITVDGVPTTVTTSLEVVGGFICSLGDVAALMPGVTDDVLADRREEVETRIERSCKRAFRPRYQFQTAMIGPGPVRLQWGWLRSIRSLDVWGRAWSQSEIATLGVDWARGKLPAVWAPWPQAAAPGITVGYEHGADYAPPNAREAVLAEMEASYGSAASSAIDPRVVSQTADNMAVTYASPATAGTGVGSNLLSPVARQFVRSYAAALVG